MSQELVNLINALNDAINNLARNTEFIELGSEAERVEAIFGVLDSNAVQELESWADTIAEDL